MSSSKKNNDAEVVDFTLEEDTGSECEVGSFDLVKMYSNNRRNVPGGSRNAIGSQGQGLGGAPGMVPGQPQSQQPLSRPRPFNWNPQNQNQFALANTLVSPASGSGYDSNPFQFGFGLGGSSYTHRANAAPASAPLNLNQPQAFHFQPPNSAPPPGYQQTHAHPRPLPQQQQTPAYASPYQYSSRPQASPSLAGSFVPSNQPSQFGFATPNDFPAWPGRNPVQNKNSVQKPQESSKATASTQKATVPPPPPQLTPEEIGGKHGAFIDPPVPSTQSTYAPYPTSLDLNPAPASTRQAGQKLCNAIAETLETRSTYRTSYNPETIVQDLLQAFGLQEGPRLNEHLEPLMKIFPGEVTEDSDLGTFNWDLAFPNGLPPGGLEEVLANMPPSVQPNAPVTRNPILPPARGLSMGGASGSMNDMRDHRPSQPSMLRHASTPDTNQGFSVMVPSPSKSMQQSATPGLTAEGYTTPHSTSSSTSTPRRGRPPGSVNKSTSMLTPTKQGRTSESGSDRLSTDPLSQDHSTPAPTSTIKRRGRPAKDPEAAAVAAAIAASTPEGVPKKRGRPFKDLPQVPVPEPHYNAFICEWKGCPAELMNLEYLRMHIHATHRRKSDGKYKCLWGSCAKTHREVVHEETEIVSLIEGVELANKAEFNEHVEKEHLFKVAWHMGDGPKGTYLKPKPTTLREREPWLFNAAGEQVTPSVHNQPSEGGIAALNNAHRFAKSQGSKSSTDGNMQVIITTPKKEKLAGYVAVADAEEEEEEDVDMEGDVEMEGMN